MNIFDSVVVSIIIEYLPVYIAAELRSVNGVFYSAYYDVYPDDDKFSLCGMKFRCGLIYGNKHVHGTLKVHSIKDRIVTAIKRQNGPADNCELHEYMRVLDAKRDVYVGSVVLVYIGQNKYKIGNKYGLNYYFGFIPKYDYILSNCMRCNIFINKNDIKINDTYSLSPGTSTVLEKWIFMLDWIKKSELRNTTVYTNIAETDKMRNALFPDSKPGFTIAIISDYGEKMMT